MSAGTERCVGLAPDGITDPVAECLGLPDPAPRTDPSDPAPRPACVIEPEATGELPLAGAGAFASLDGRGWDPAHCRPRRPVLPLLLRLEGGLAAGAGDWLAAHLRALGGAAGARHIVAVPDRLAELGQQRLLDGLRRANLRAELLWRPVATLLGWARGLPPADLEALHQQTVLVVHLGFWAPEVSRLEVEVQTADDARWLVPIRDGRGRGLPAGQDWPIEQAAQDLLAADLARIGLNLDAVAPDLVWQSRRPWATLCGVTPPAEIIRDCAGQWHRLHRDVPVTDAVASQLRGPVLAMLREQVQQGPAVQRVLIDGPLTRLPVGATTLGRLIAGQWSEWTGLGAQAIEVLPVAPSFVARGAAHYGWRRGRGIPGYFDTVPDLLINACVDGRAEFVSLMAGQQRVRGGEALPPKEDDRFSVAAGASRIEYYLARGDEPTVRKTEVADFEPPKEATRLRLIVRQTHGQGFAEAEVRAAAGAHLSVRPLFLDWRLMDDTLLTREQVLNDLAGQCTVAYPPPEPLECHAAVWRAQNLPVRIRDFLALGQGGIVGTGAQLALNLDGGQGFAVIEALRDALRAKCTTSALRKAPALRNHFSASTLAELLPDDGNTYSAVSSDGTIPDESQFQLFKLWPPAGYESWQALFDALVAKIEDDFASCPGDANALERRKKLLGAGSWCYARTAPAMLTVVGSALRNQPAPAIGQQEVFRAAGRCLHAPADFQALFEMVHSIWGAGKAVKMYHTDAIGYVLAYRPDAPNLLTPEIANGLAEIAVAEMDAQKKKPAKKFLSAAAMLVMLLRYRARDPGFLNPANPHHRPLVDQINKILNQHLPINLKNRQKLVELFPRMRDFIAARGSPLPIFTDLSGLADDDGPDDGN